ncbi:Cytochrome P450 alkane hydroxylase, partial [Rasamsonia emersonii CBS 393.64]
MTLSYSVLAASFLATYVVYLLARSIFRALRRRRLAKIHGCRPPPQLPSPFFGIPAFFDLVRAAKRKQVVQHIEKIVARCGTTFERTILGYSQIATIDPENIKAMLATQFNDFALGTRHEIFYPLLGDGIFTLDGAGWSHSRALLRPQFTRDQVADIGMLSSHVDHFLAALPKDRTAFDIQELLFRLTLDSATEFLFGESTHSLSPNFVAGSGPLANCGGEEGFAHAFNLAQEYLVDRGRAQALYWLINPPKFRQAVKLVHEVVDYYVDQAIKKSQQLEKKDSSGSDNKRYVFLEAVARDTQDRKVLRDQMLNILLAGRDTTASLLSSSFFYLARHPRVWTRLREEIIRAFPPTESADTITIERLREVKYLRYFLNE